MQPVTRTPPVPDISRCKLKQVACWIRDDLDLLVAREGPNSLQPDDVLFLHELFVALCQSTTITALDLRATGIHKAVKDIAGIATRWPGRLCDDCDRIIVVWTSKFGKFDNLHPFLCGRGGRLEGIASVTEYTRQALLKRWSEHCPEKIHPSVAHRHGDLGFKAGDWWINPLFAHHAGIIGLESVAGGTTYDKNSAYALVLKDTGEMDATSENAFSYRCPINDKGKFRLTAATPTARDPIRVLRSHSINSIWGPKAGIRYEGLFSVKGWSVRRARLKDTFCGEWKEGDILYEVMMQRRDPVPVEEVSRRPTNMEVDDYVEYKRLRKLHREHKRKAPGELLMPQQPLKAAPPILPLPVSSGSTAAPQSMLRASPSVSRKAAFKEPVFDPPIMSQWADRPPSTDVVSPMTVPGRQESFFLARPAVEDKRRSSPATSFDTVSHEKDTQMLGPSIGSQASSLRSGQSDLKEIIPWIDLEADVPVPSPSNAPPAAKEMPPQAMERPEAKAAAMNPVKKIRKLARDAGRPSEISAQGPEARKKSNAANERGLKLHPSKPIVGRKREKPAETERGESGMKKLLGRKPRLFDGAGISAHEGAGSQSTPHLRSTSAIPLHSPTPTRRPTPDPLLATDSHLVLSHGLDAIEFTSPLDDLPSSSVMSFPISVPVAMPRAEIWDRRVGLARVFLGLLRGVVGREGKVL
ncbi:uncharacterized protein EKO05_0007102 [Ascochyta rabiei]|uniref:uncharacterized protein n=1 Tax=Didymella rabiei TaxID=5454 RepID=UPI00220ED34C|nr:uncharacterized protein EKO05_0007102 [Ascochyta rabiei]UPX16714.1 hypothetical protein EKO05_0007102 [Ascochyta rabiei]